MSEVVYDGIVYLEQAAVPLLALPQCVFRLFSLSDVEEGDDGADSFAMTNQRMRPILNWETGSVLSPKNVIVDMDATVFVEAYKNGNLVEAFGSGTAAVVSHISEITHGDNRMVLPTAEKQVISNMLYDEINGLRAGRIPDNRRWLVPVEVKSMHETTIR